MPHKVALWIYWHALKLWWKKVSFIQHPRYHNPTYREDALIRNENIQLCPAFGNREAYNHQRDEPPPKIGNNRCLNGHGVEPNTCKSCSCICTDISEPQHDVSRVLNI